MPAQIRAILLSALGAAAPAALALVSTPGASWALVAATFVVAFAAGLLLALFHLAVPAPTQAAAAAALAPALAQLAAGVVAALERSPVAPAVPLPLTPRRVNPDGAAVVTRPGTAAMTPAPPPAPAPPA